MPWLGPDLPLFNTESVSVPYQARSGSSQQGAEKVLPKAGTQASLILAALETPRTLHELVTITGFPLATCCARVGALKRKGLVVEAGTKMGPYSVPNTVYQACR